MPYKAIVSDLDGTLLNSEHRLGDYSRQVLRQLHDSGRKIILATGRHYLDVNGIREKIGAPLFLITSNGAQIHDPAGQALVEHTLPASVIGNLVDLGRDADVRNNIYKADRWLVEIDDPSLRRFFKDSGFNYQVADFHDIDPSGVTKYFFGGRHDVLLELEAQLLAAEFADQVQVVFSAPVCLEVMVKGISKGEALKEVLVHKGLQLSDVIAFGDSMNDQEMLALAGKGILMENSMPRLKAALSHLEVIGHHENEAVARHLERLFALAGEASPPAGR